MSLDFVRTYAQLISLSPDAPAESFYSTEEYHKLQTLGPTLPVISHPLPTHKVATESEATISVKLKSIKPPFKFSRELLGVSTTLSIYKLKCQLIDEESLLKQAGAGPEHLKFMVKSKILTDTTTMGLFGDELSITVVVTQPKSLPKETEQILPSDEMDPEADVPKIISPKTWDEIESLVASDLGSEAARATIAKWKSVTL